MKATVLTDNADYAEQLSRQLSGAFDVEPCPHSRSAPELLGWLKETAPALVVVDVDGGPSFDGPGLIEKVSQRVPMLTVVAMGTRADAGVLLAVMRAGASDFVEMTHAGQEGDDLALRLMRLVRRELAPGKERIAPISLVMGAAPYDGVPFLAAHLALALQQRMASGERCLLVDLSYPSSASMVFLDVKQEFTLSDGLGDIGRCDETLINTAFPRHDASGIFCLGLPDDQVDPPLVDAEAIAGLLDVLVGHFAHIVVAADPVVSLSTLQTLLDMSQQAFLLTDQSILKSRRADRLLQALRAREADLTHTQLVIDGYRARLGLAADKLERLLGLSLAATLGGNRVTHIQARNAGQSLFQVAPRDPYVRGVAELAQRLRPPAQTTDSPIKQGFLQRLLG